MPYRHFPNFKNFEGESIEKYTDKVFFFRSFKVYCSGDNDYRPYRCIGTDFFDVFSANSGQTLSYCKDDRPSIISNILIFACRRFCSHKGHKKIYNKTDDICSALGNTI